MKDFERRLLCQGAIVLLLTGVAFFFMWFAPASAVEEIPLPNNPLQGGAQAKPGYVYSFPHDHGSHDQFGLEWWYFTGHLFNESGRQFGYELTFFRKAIDDPRVQNSSSHWAIKQLYFAHLALTDVENQTFRFAEKLSRAGLGKAGARADQMEVWIDRWSLNSVTSDHHVLSLKASEESFGLAAAAAASSVVAEGGSHERSPRSPPGLRWIRAPMRRARRRLSASASTSRRR